MQRPRRDLSFDKVSQVQRVSASDNLLAETACFVFDSLFYGELVQLFKKRISLYCSLRLKNGPSSGVLYLLEQLGKCLWRACQQEVAVI